MTNRTLDQGRSAIGSRVAHTHQNDRRKWCLKPEDFGGGFVIKASDPDTSQFLGHGLKLKVLGCRANLEVNISRAAQAVWLLVGECLARRYHVSTERNDAGGICYPLRVSDRRFPQRRAQIGRNQGLHGEINRINPVEPPVQPFYMVRYNE